MNPEVAAGVVIFLFYIGTATIIGWVFDAGAWMVAKLRRSKQLTPDDRLASLVTRYYDAGYNDGEAGRTRRDWLKPYDTSDGRKRMSSR